jgi:glutaredoxin
MDIEIWGKEDCVFCIASVELCKMKNLDYTYKTYNVDFSLQEIKEEFVGAKTFPQIKIDGKPIGGFHELEKLL